MNETKILIVEDDVDNAVYIKEFLEECSFVVEVFTTTTDAIFHLKFDQYSLILLDLNLPDFEGFELLKFLNDLNYSIPVIVLSAYSEVEMKLKAFKYGAKDYVVKPADPNELEARIWVQLGRNSRVRVQLENNFLRLVNNEIYFKNKLLKLTRTEYKILLLLIENRNKIIKREELYNIISSKSNQRTLDGHIKNIRKKIAFIDKSDKEIIATEYGIGYKLIS